MCEINIVSQLYFDKKFMTQGKFFKFTNMQKLKNKLLNTKESKNKSKVTQRILLYAWKKTSEAKTYEIQ